MMQKKSEDAVSPVIGVMLLLVVTIIIAAVVAVFASGVGTDAETAPTTVLDVTDITDYGESSMKEPRYSFSAVDYKNEFGKDSIKTVQITNTEGKKKLRWTYADTGEYLFDTNDKGEDDYTKPQSPNVEKYVVTNGWYPVTLTLNSVAGDVLDLSKLSVKVYNSKGKAVAEIHQNALSGTISPGDTMTLTLDEIYDETLNSNKDKYNTVRPTVVTKATVEVIVLYGEHVVVSKELKVTKG